MNPIDSIQLQRLIDGQLNDASIRQLVQAAEDHPELWRQIGSAFVEDRVFKSAMVGIMDDEADVPASGFSTTGNRSTELNTKQSNQAAGRNGSGGLNGSRFGFLSLVASALLALTAGLFGGWHLNNEPVGPDSNIATVENPETDPSPGTIAIADNDRTGPAAVPTQTLVNYEPDYRLDLQDAGGRQVFGGEVPLYTSERALAAGYRVDNYDLPEALILSARESGFHFDQKVRYVTGSLSDGREFVVPVRTIHFSAGQ